MCLGAAGQTGIPAESISDVTYELRGSVCTYLLPTSRLQRVLSSPIGIGRHTPDELLARHRVVAITANAVLVIRLSQKLPVVAFTFSERFCATF